MRNTVLTWGLALLATLFCSCKQNPGLLHINPMIGTGAATATNTIGDISADYGKIIPAVGVPHGMTSWTPQTDATERKCLPPYFYQRDCIQGFRASHWMNGSCTQDYGSVTIMPMNDELVTEAQLRASKFSHDEETSTPSYYSVPLKDYGIFGEITGLSRSGIMKFTFDTAGDHYIVVEPNSDEHQATVKLNPEKGEISGSNPVHRLYQGNGKPAGFSGHFVVQTSVDPVDMGLWDGGAWILFHLKKPGEVLIKVGTSFTSVDNARMNLEMEIPGWNFNKVRKQSEDAWGDILDRIVAEGGSTEKMEKFYTALYDALIMPRTYSDVDGSWPGFGYSGPRKSENTVYGDFSMWDTFRAQHPLLTLLSPSKTSDMVSSLVCMGEEGGWLPIFPAWGSYTSAMIGDHGISVIGDAIMKGIEGFDIAKAYALMHKNAFEVNDDLESYKDGKGRRALDSYLKYGYVPLEDGVPYAFHRNEQTSRTLEYAYDDFVLAQVARKLGHDADADSLEIRAGFWRNVIDPVTGYARGKHTDGTFSEPFNPNVRASYICEGTPYHYTWFVPHDVTGLVEHLGGKERFSSHLDTFFSKGYYWHGNEPSHHIAYLYPFVGEVWKTQKLVHEIIDREYKPHPDGLSGNDDCGQMSAWLVFSMMGFYPVCPGIPEYVIGSPSFEKLTINLENGNRFIVEAENLSDKNIYIQSATLNGKPFEGITIQHSDIIAGGCLHFVMGAEPALPHNHASTNNQMR